VKPSPGTAEKARAVDPTYGLRLLKVGQMDVPGPQVFWMSAWDRWLTLSFTVLLVEGHGLRLLVNAGPPDDLAPLNEHVRSVLGERACFTRRPEERLLVQLEGLDLRPEDITHVVVTPFTLYSTGGLHLFPKAEVFLSRRGWIAFHTTHDHPHDVRWATLSKETLRYLVIDAWDRVRLLEDEDEIAPGIRTWWAGAHHRASIAVEIDTPAGVAVASDAFFYRENVLGNHPLGIGESIDEALVCYARVRRVADHILPLTDPELLELYRGGVLAELG
jgi:hypothetical protein